MVLAPLVIIIYCYHMIITKDYGWGALNLALLVALIGTFLKGSRRYGATLDSRIDAPFRQWRYRNRTHTRTFVEVERESRFLGIVGSQQAPRKPLEV